MTCAKPLSAADQAAARRRSPGPNLGPGCLTGTPGGLQPPLHRRRDSHIGALLSTDLKEVVTRAEVLVIGAKALDEETISAILRPDQLVIDLRSLLPRSAAVGVMANHQMVSA